jgi:NADP-dependent 3-hydroxy acid dehydrogenase YdfG
MAPEPVVYLVTGCSSGFGVAFVDHILKNGDKVIATARNSARIANLKAKGAETLELDVTWPFEKIEAAFTQAEQIYGHIDVLINNAGYVVAGFLEETT